MWNALLLCPLSVQVLDCYPADPEPRHERLIAVPLEGRAVHVLDVVTQKIVKSFKTTACIEDVQIAHDGKSAACIDEHGRLLLVSLEGDAEPRTLSASPVMKIGDADWDSYSLAWSPRGDRLAVLHSFVELEIVDLAAWTIRRVELDGMPVRMKWSHDGTRLAIGMEPRRVSIVEVSADSKPVRFELAAISPHPVVDAVSALEFGPADDVLAIGCWGAFVEVWDLARVRPLAVLEAGQHWAPQCNFEISDLAFSPDGHRLVATTVDRRMLTEWEWASGRRLMHLDADGGNPFPLRVMYSADGATIRCNWLALTLCSGKQPTPDPFVNRPYGWIHPLPDDRFGIQYTPRGADLFDFATRSKICAVVDGAVVR